MGSGKEENRGDFAGLWSTIRDRLQEKGIDIEAACCGGPNEARVKVVCVAPDLAESVQEMGQAPRGQTVMVRLDVDTVETLDAWVETGCVKSRSEAAALFIREGLKVRVSELEQLKDALQQVREAKRRVREKAREVFGDERPKPPA